jgi:hypothetical protein
MQIKFAPNDTGSPVGKLADAELHFAEGSLDEMKLTGFAIWETATAGQRVITFPARTYSVHPKRISVSLLQPIADNQAHDRLRDLILNAYMAPDSARLGPGSISPNPQIEHLIGSPGFGVRSKQAREHPISVFINRVRQHSSICESTGGSPMTVKFTPNDKGNPPGKLADAELYFSGPPLEGLKLIGFGVWERRGNSGRNVTFPARQYSVNGERRSFALLRPVVDPTAQNQIRDIILAAYAEYEREAAEQT